MVLFWYGYVSAWESNVNSVIKQYNKLLRTMFKPLICVDLTLNLQIT